MELKRKNTTASGIISVRRLAGSFGHAFNGLRRVMCREQNMRIHLLVALCTAVAGYCFRISAAEWTAIGLATGGVLAAETFNTSIEALSDTLSPEYSEKIKQVKDLAAGAVLLVALAAAATGLIIFLPKLIALC
ncbi:MAG: diacylglycerol kinase family protein [Tannerella sp.]|jgi:diacylglycerol kinase (ATP)|nr:diacylglycerol kinase family protein [Tannerella sp.]